jgi:hypothetical protein
VLLGLVAAAVYVVALVVTVGDGARPLYDGFAPPAPYRWVDPPPFFAADNVAPGRGSVTVPIRRGVSAAVGVSTPDGQAVLNLAAGAIPATGADRRARVVVTPVDPARLAPVGGGLRANGNAYRVEVRLEPTGARVTRLTVPGTFVVQVPELNRALLTSRSGREWSPVEATPLPPRQLSLSTELVAPGYYLGATDLPQLHAPAGGSSNTALLIGVGTAVGAGLLFALALVLRRRRHHPPPDPA